MIFASQGYTVNMLNWLTYGVTVARHPALLAGDAVTYSVSEHTTPLTLSKVAGSKKKTKLFRSSAAGTMRL
jgi:hypothetical protein